MLLDFSPEHPKSFSLHPVVLANIAQLPYECKPNDV